jgi:hypothetical protein
VLGTADTVVESVLTVGTVAEPVLGTVDTMIGEPVLPAVETVPAEPYVADPLGSTGDPASATLTTSVIPVALWNSFSSETAASSAGVVLQLSGGGASPEPGDPMPPMPPMPGLPTPSSTPGSSGANGGKSFDALAVLPAGALPPDLSLLGLSADAATGAPSRAGVPPVSPA